MRGSLIGFPLMVLFLLPGCTAVKTFRGMKLSEDGVLIHGVPPVLQDKTTSCGPACVAAVCGYWGVRINPADQKTSKEIPESSSNYSASELALLAKTAGLAAFAYRGSDEDLRYNIAKGRPVIVMIPKLADPAQASIGMAGPFIVWMWNEFAPKPPHWVVVIGTIGSSGIIIHDPDAGRLLISADLFARGWMKTGQLSVLISPVPTKASSGVSSPPMRKEVYNR